MAKSEKTTSKKAKKIVKRKGIHAKTKSSRNKNSKNYVKIGRGQGL